MILRIKIIGTLSGIALSQTHYVENLIKKINFSAIKSACSPVNMALKLHKHDGSPVA